MQANIHNPFATQPKADYSAFIIIAVGVALLLAITTVLAFAPVLFIPLCFYKRVT